MRMRGIQRGMFRLRDLAFQRLLLDGNGNLYGTSAGLDLYGPGEVGNLFENHAPGQSPHPFRKDAEGRGTLIDPVE